MFGFGLRRPSMVAFDAIGTVFPVEPLRGLLTPLGFGAQGLELLMATAYRNAMTLATVGAYKPFASSLRSALEEMLAERGLRASPRSKAAVVEGLGGLAARPDAGAAFRLLRQAGIGVAVLTNGTAPTTERLLVRNGLDRLVDTVVSADEVKLSKPRPEVYLHMAKVARVRRGRLALVAAHAWDIKGADEAGLTTGFVSAERAFDPLMGRPDVQGPTLLAVAQALAAL